MIGLHDDGLRALLMRDGTSGLFDLAKSMSAAGSGSLSDFSNMNSGRAITLENVDKALTKVIYSEVDFVANKLIARDTITNIVDRYTRQSGYGAVSNMIPFGVAQTETGMPSSTELTLLTDFSSIKYLRTMKSISHPMEKSDSFINPLRVIDESAALEMLEDNERLFFYGDSSLNPYMYDGIIKQIEDIHAGTTSAKYNKKADVVIDLRNSYFTEETIIQACRNIQLNFGLATNMIMPIELKSDLDSRLLKNSLRTNTLTVASTPTGYMAGYPVDKYNTGFAQGGQVLFNSTRFLRDGYLESLCPTAVLGTAPVTCDDITGAATPDPLSKFVAADIGSYYYKIVPFNSTGSLAGIDLTTGAAVSVTTGDKVTITITNSSTTATGYYIYRSAKDASSSSDCRYIGAVAKSTSPYTTFIDYNDNIPGTAIALVLDCRRDSTGSMSFRQLIPFSKYTLPYAYGNIFAQSYVYNLYIYLRLMKAGAVLIKNIKLDSTAF